MKILFRQALVGLLCLGVIHGRHHYRSEEETPTRLAITEPPPVNVSSVLANYEGLNLIHNAEQKTIGFVNVTDNVGLSITGDEILVLDSKTGHVLSYKQKDKAEITQNDEFKGDVLKSLNLVLDNYVFKNEPIAGKSQESSSEDAVAIWSNVYLHLGHPKEKGSKDFQSLKYLKIFEKSIKHLFTRSLQGLIVGNGPFPLKQNLNRFVTISLGLHELFTAATGGLKSILAKGVSFEVNSLYNAKNGVEVLVYVLRQTGAKFDLSLIWGNLLNNVDKLLDVVGKLGGGESKNGVDETFAIINHFWSAIHLKIPITNFIQFLFESASDEIWSKADDGDLKQVLKDIKNVTDEQSKKYDNVIKLSGFVKFFTNLTTNQLIENNVNVSELVEKWRKRDAIGGLKTISHLGLNLFNPAKYSNLLFDSFNAFLNATSDKDAVKKILPGVSLEDLANTNGSVLNSINETYKIDEKLKKGADPSQVLSGIPVFNQFSKVFKDSVGKDFDFSKALNGGTFGEYLSKLNIPQPFKMGTDALSKFAEESGSILTHIFVDPIKHFLPIPNLPIPGLQNPVKPGSEAPSMPFLPPGFGLPSIPGLPNPAKSDSEASPSIPFLPSGLPNLPSIPGLPNLPIPSSSDSPGVSGLLSTATVEPEPEKVGSKETVTAGIDTAKRTTEDDDEDATKSPSSELPTTPAAEETHLTVSVSAPTTEESESEEGSVNPDVSPGTTKKDCDDCGEDEPSKPTKTETSEPEKGSVIIDDSLKTTKKECDDCEEDEGTKSSTAKSIKVSTEASVELRHHHNRHHHLNRHHHSRKLIDRQIKYQQSRHLAGNDHHSRTHGAHHEKKHHSGKHLGHHEKKHVSREHQGKEHHYKKHQDKKHHERNHHNVKGHKLDEEHHARNYKHQHEGKHHQRVLEHHSEKHHDRSHHNV